MRVIRFPGAAESGAAGLAAGERVDALLGGELASAEGEALRVLRDDVRALAVPIAPGFEAELQARLAEWAAPAPVRRARRSPNERLRALRLWLGASPARMLAGGGAAAAAAVLAVVAALALSGGPRDMAGHDVSRAEFVGRSAPGKATEQSAKTLPEAVSRANRSKPSFSEGAPEGAGSTLTAPAVSSGSALGRLQQLAATVTLATSPGGVQQAAEAASRLAVSDGGFVERSQVQVRSTGGPSEAQLRLQIPSAKLSSAIAALGRIAPERAVNQESEDITSAYDSAKRRLGDAEAVRRALLRALAAATSEGAVDSLRERLAQSRSQIAEYRSQVKGEAHRAATSELEVTITGSGGSASGQSTLGRGLHDAGHVLAVAGAVALVALAAIVPLALVAFALETLRRAWRRRRRESALDA